MVVQHPFTSSGFVGISNNGEMELLSILESAESKNKWQEFMEMQITNADSVYRIFNGTEIRLRTIDEEIAELSRQSLVIFELMKKGIKYLFYEY